MKKAVCLLTFALVCTLTRAQFGITGGLSLSKYKYNSDDRKELMTFNAGIVCRVQHKNSSFAIQPMLAFVGKGAVKYNDPFSTNPVMKYTNRTNYAELSLPFLFSPQIDEDGIFRFDIGVGPYVSYLLNAKYTAETYEGVKTDGSYKIGSSATDDFKPADAGLSIVGAMHFGRFASSIQYDMGLTNVNPVTSGTPLKMRAVLINLTVYFGK